MPEQPRTLDLMAKLNGPVTERELIDLVFDREGGRLLPFALTPECRAEEFLSAPQEKRTVRAEYISMRLARMQGRARVDFWVEGMRGKYMREPERGR